MCKDVTIALVGKYTKLEDSYASVTKALQHAAVAAGFRLKIKVENEECRLCLINVWFNFLFALFYILVCCFCLTNVRYLFITVY